MILNARYEDMKIWNALGLIVLTAFASAVAQPRYDILIRGGRVLDGSGNPWFTRDVAIENGRIAAVGRPTTRPAVRATIA